MESIIKGYEQVLQEHAERLESNTKAMTALYERLEPGSVLTEHIAYSTQVLTRLCAHIETWNDRMGPKI